MKIDRDEEWWVSRARAEADLPMVAGALAFQEPYRTEGVSTESASPSAMQSERQEEGRLAFGQLVRLMRRRLRLSIEELADAADVEVGEVLRVEDDLRFHPDPRLVFQFARVFGLPQQGLMEVAGLIVGRDERLARAAVRFAARSEAPQRLSPQEADALDAFIAVLADGGAKS
ncbi:MAG: hypothetical protein JWM95_1563 [Gemmatimonadetes bacterium]|nr:hypothetical protein [Gemmatimonadota bacterium]